MTYIFDDVPILLSFEPELAPMTFARFVKPRRAVDEEERLIDVVFLLQLTEKHLYRGGNSAGTERGMENIV